MRMIIFVSLILLSLIDDISATSSGLNVFLGDSFRGNVVKQRNSSADVCTEWNKIAQATSAKFSFITSRIADLERKLEDLLRTMTYPTPKITSFSCPTGYEYYYQEKFCYKFQTICRTWAEAKTVCIQEGAELISLSAVNFGFFRDLARSRAGTCGGSVWVGTTDASSEGQWLWLNGGKVAHSLWASDQPDNYANKENCGDLSKLFDYKMNDEDCSSKQNFICRAV
ncbi:hypothetical protein ACJMK2_032064 [Sinanodonta woodiana]|uniref:C-type lectin domain-containing protein n=1 Tax=Sinanodonta woodiana TaxID=1069815 RepID=A0ABD3X4L7_SINWO